MDNIAEVKSFDSVIFDLDGTLWNTVDSCVKILAEVKERHKEITKDITAESVISCMGMPFEKIVENYYGYIEKDKAIIFAQEAFQNNIKNLLENGGTPYPNLENTIKKLSKKYKLCIVSNCVEGYIESFLKTSNLKAYFYDYESNGRTKLSKGENIKLVIKRNHFNNAIYVGDTASDEEAANYANIPFVWASYGFGKAEKYDYQLKQLSDLTNLL